MPPEQLPRQPQATVPETLTAPPPQPPKDKYKLFSAIGSAFRAIKYNLGLVSLGLLVTVILQVTQQLIIYKYFPLSETNPTQPQMQLWQLLIYVPFGLVGVVVGIYTTMVIADGAHHEREHVGAYFRVALQRFWRVTVSYFFMGVYVLLPTAGAVIVISALWAAATLSEIKILEVLSVIFIIVGGIATFIGALATFLRYSLAGYSAMFELNIPARQTPKRSQQLLKGAGEEFIVKFILLSLLLIIPLVILTMFMAASSSSVSSIQRNTIYLNLFFAPYGVISSAIILMLFFNRREIKPAIETQPAKLRWKGRTFIGLTVLGIIVLALSAPSLIRRNNLQRQQKLDQQAAAQRAAIEDRLSLYTNKEHGYALKLPKDFVLSISNSTEGDVFRTPAGPTPFILVIKSLPQEPKFVYANDQTAGNAVDSIVGSFDDYLQYSTGTTDTTTVSGDINIPGTRHKRGIFSRVGTPNVAGEEINMRIIIIPRDDGTSLMANITYLKQTSRQLDPVIDIIFKSVDLQLK